MVPQEEVGDEEGESALGSGPRGEVVGTAEGGVGEDFARVLPPGLLAEGVLEEKGSGFGEAGKGDRVHDLGGGQGKDTKVVGMKLCKGLPSVWFVS